RFVSRVHTERASSKAANRLLAVLRAMAGDTLPIENAEVHASSRPLFGMALARPNRQSACNGADRPFLVLPAIPGAALPIGDAEIHLDGGPVLRVVLCLPHREAILKTADGPLAILRRVARKALPVGNAEVHPSSRPLFWMSFARPDQQAILESADCPFLIFRSGRRQDGPDRQRRGASARRPTLPDCSPSSKPKVHLRTRRLPIPSSATGRLRRGARIEGRGSPVQWPHRWFRRAALPDEPKLRDRFAARATR